jgi:hypothetical protein
LSKVLDFLELPPPPCCEHAIRTNDENPTKIRFLKVLCIL